MKLSSREYFNVVCSNMEHQVIRPVKARQIIWWWSVADDHSMVVQSHVLWYPVVLNDATILNGCEAKIDRP